MRLVLGNLLLFIALGLCFKSTHAQETTAQTDENTTILLPNDYTVESMLSSENISATPENTVTLLQTETILGNEINTVLEEPTGGSTPPLSTYQTSPETVPETTTVQTEQTTVTTTTLPVNVETTVIEQITSDAPSTSQNETTVSFTSPEPTSPTERPTDEITTAAVAINTDSSEALNPTSILTTPPADWTESPSIVSNPVETSTETSITTSTTSTSTTQLPQNTADYPSLRSDKESVSTYFTTTITGVLIEPSDMPMKTIWLIIIVCVAIIFVLCVSMTVFIQRRKKTASRNFSPMYINGQSKRSRKKKGAEDDAWAGPVKMEAGVECDAVVQEGLMPNSGKQDGDDMVLSTFAALDAGDTSNGGVGGDGTKEAKKWEEQEPLFFIDEDVNEDKTGKTLAENEKQKGDEKSEEKGMNGGETFCLTTAV